MEKLNKEHQKSTKDITMNGGLPRWFIEADYDTGDAQNYRCFRLCMHDGNYETFSSGDPVVDFMAILQRAAEWEVNWVADRSLVGLLKELCHTGNPSHNGVTIELAYVSGA